MAKSKTLESEEMMRLLDEYRLENSGAKITIPKFGEYVRSKGIEIQDYTIRRDERFRKYMNEVMQNSEERMIHDLVTYKTIDIEAFFKKNNTKEKLKEAIILRDRYYANIAANAAEAIKAKKSAEMKLQKYEKRVEELEQQLTAVQARVDNADIRKKNETITKLKEILSSYVYPDAANAILEREGLLEVANSVIPDEIMEEKTVCADTDIMDIQESKYSSVNNLLGGFDE